MSNLTPISGRGTQILVRMKHTHYDSVTYFLKSQLGCFSIYPTNRQGEYVFVEAQYNIYYGYWERRRLKRSVAKREGNLIEASPLGRKPPMFDEKTQKIIRNSALVSTITFLTAAAGNHVITGFHYEIVIEMAIIPALTAFFTKIATDLGVPIDVKKPKSQEDS